MSIVYIVDKKIFPDNSNCEFKSILPNDFDVKLLCPDKVLLVSVHRICFTVNKPHNLQFISINSDILNDHQFVNNKLNQQLWSFRLPELNVNESPQIFELINENPVYCETTVNKLKEASFQIIDSQTNQNINNIIDQTVPLVLEIAFKTVKMEKYRNMNIFVRSKCPDSMKIFHENNNTDFSILLAKTIKFENKCWGVQLKDFSIPKNFANVQKDLFWVQFGDYEFTENISCNTADGNNCKVKVNITHTRKPNTDNYGEAFSMDPGFYTLTKFIKEVNKIFSQCDCSCKLIEPSILSYSNDKRIKININPKRQEDGQMKRKELRISYRLAVALGFILPNENQSFSYGLDVTESGTQTFNYPVNINYFYPRQIILNCDILSNSIVGNRQCQMLYIKNVSDEELQSSDKILTLNKINNIIRDIDINTFNKIRFWITDLKGDKLNTANQNDDDDDDETMISFTLCKLT